MSADRGYPDTPVFDEPESAVAVVARETGETAERAREILRALVKAGYVIGPREPTNAMLHAYITSYGEIPSNPASTITAIGKARRRWQAMADKATAMTLSMHRVTVKRTQDAGDAQDTPQSAGGRARAKRLTPERRSEIAKQAAAARWTGQEAPGVEKDGK